MKRAVDDGLRDALNKYDAKGNVWKDQIDYLQSEVRLLRVWMGGGGGGVWYSLFNKNLAHYSSH